jgi:methyl-accepting chemotaxis protein
MKKIFFNLSISKRLLLIALTGIFTFLISIGIIISTFSYIQKSDAELNNLATTLFYHTEISVGYNGMRGDMYNLLITPSSDLQNIREIKERYEKRKEELKNNKTLLIANNHNPDLQKPIEEFVKIVDEIPTFIDENEHVIMLGYSENDSITRLITQKIRFGFEPRYLAIRTLRRAISSQILSSSNKLQTESQSHITQALWLIVSLFVIAGILILVITNLVGKSFTKPIHWVKQALQELSEGKLPEIKSSNSTNELGEMINSLKNVVHNLVNLKEFTTNVGKGNFEMNVDIFQNKGDIASSLIMMRDNLKESAEKDQQTRWISEGVAETGKLLRQNHKDEAELYHAILSFAVKYLSVNQGSLFMVVNEESNPVLELVASWAYNRKKYLSKTIAVGEGLVGQAYLEKQPVMLTAIPDNYLQITSGLGSANPRNIVIIPLITNDVVQGVLEIASFTVLSNYHLDFLKQFSELLAAEIAVSKTNRITRQLLETSQEQAEEMRAQEEEMRQNMEEMQATQEEILRNNIETEARMKALDKSGIGFVEFDMNGIILTANDSMLEAMGGYTLAEVQGKHHSIFVKPVEVQTEEYKIFWKELAKGKAIIGEFERISKTGEIVFLMGSYTPIKDSHDNIQKIVKFAADITETKKLLNESQQMTQQLSAQEGMMREVLEEMQLTQSESLEEKNKEIAKLRQRIKELEEKVESKI